MLIATPQFAIQGIKRVADLGWEPVKILTAVSASVAAVIEPAGKDIATGWVSDTYIKDSTDPQFADDPAVLEYKEILAAYDPNANPDDGLYLYGMSVAQTFERLVQSLPTVCRESIMAAVKNFEWADPPLLYPGIEIRTGPGDGFPDPAGPADEVGRRDLGQERVPRPHRRQRRLTGPPTGPDGVAPGAWCGLDPRHVLGGTCRAPSEPGARATPGLAVGDDEAVELGEVLGCGVAADVAMSCAARAAGPGPAARRAPSAHPATTRRRRGGVQPVVSVDDDVSESADR